MLINLSSNTIASAGVGTLNTIESLHHLWLYENCFFFLIYILKYDLKFVIHTHTRATCSHIHLLYSINHDYFDDSFINSFLADS